MATSIIVAHYGGHSARKYGLVKFGSEQNAGTGFPDWALLPGDGASSGWTGGALDPHRNVIIGPVISRVVEVNVVELNITSPRLPQKRLAVASATLCGSEAPTTLTMNLYVFGPTLVILSTGSAQRALAMTIRSITPFRQ